MLDWARYKIWILSGLGGVGVLGVGGYAVGSAIARRSSEPTTLSTIQIPSQEEQNKEIEDYLKKRTILLMSPNPEYNQQTGSTNPKTIMGFGFILGQAADLEKSTKPNSPSPNNNNNKTIYYILSDMGTIQRFTHKCLKTYHYLDGDNIYKGFYLQPEVNKNSTRSYPHILTQTTDMTSSGDTKFKKQDDKFLSSAYRYYKWKYQGTDINFAEKDESFSGKSNLGVNFGVMIMDLDIFNGEHTDEIDESVCNSQCQDKCKVSDPYTVYTSSIPGDENYLRSLDNNIQRYGDIDINGETINKGYVLDFSSMLEVASNSLTNTQTINNPDPSQGSGIVNITSYPKIDLKIKELTDLKDKLKKRVYNDQDYVKVDNKDYHFPTKDYHLTALDLPVGSVMVHYNPYKPPKTRFSLGGVSTWEQTDNSKVISRSTGAHQQNKSSTFLVSKLMDTDNYDAITSSSDSDNSFCKSIAKDQVHSWAGSNNITLRFPDFCNK